MNSFLPLAAAGLVLLAVCYYLWVTLRANRQTAAPEDRYHQALEQWLAGDLGAASATLENLIRDYPESIDPYLQLGKLMRLQGDPARAAVLHRGLTVRRDLSRSRKVAVGLALAEDLLDLKQYDDAAGVLDTLVRDASDEAPYWKFRFLQWHGQGNFPEAARALKRGAKVVPEKDRSWFRKAYASYQLDRALQHVRAHEFSAAGSRLKDVKGMEEAEGRALLVQAMRAAANDNPAAALTLAAEDLLDRPAELELFLPILQEVLLESGQYARTVPVLERACQSRHAPPSLWVDLALLYEKLGQRDKTMRLMESKAGDQRFTPDQAAPLLRLLVRENPATDFARVWACLGQPSSRNLWLCERCGHEESEVRWFCSQCLAFNSFQVTKTNPEGL